MKWLWQRFVCMLAGHLLAFDFETIYTRESEGFHHVFVDSVCSRCGKTVKYN